MLFGQAPAHAADPFLIDSAYQGQEARTLVEKACAAGEPVTPSPSASTCACRPAGTALETAQRLWEVDPELQIVVCTAYSDYSWQELVGKLQAHAERFLILKKPFDHIEVRQLATALSRKWIAGAARARRRVDELEELVRARTSTIREAHEQLQREVTQRQRMEGQSCGARRSWRRLAGWRPASRTRSTTRSPSCSPT